MHKKEIIDQIKKLQLKVCTIDNLAIYVTAIFYRMGSPASQKPDNGRNCQ